MWVLVPFNDHILQHHLAAHHIESAAIQKGINAGQRLSVEYQKDVITMIDFVQRCRPYGSQLMIYFMKHFSFVLYSDCRLL